MKSKKIIALILCVVFVLSAFAGCGVGTEKKSEGTRTIIDHTGAEVVIPAEINNVVISSLMPLPSVYCLFMGSAEKLIGMHPSSLAAAENSFLVEVFPEVKDVDTSFVQSGEVNAEALMEMKPDIVFYLASNTKEKELYKNAGIPAVGFSTSISGFNAIETYAAWITLLGEIFGNAEKADKIIEFGREIHQEILTQTSQIPDSEKPGVLVLYQYDNGAIKTSGSDFYGHYWIETAGGRNVAAEISGPGNINMEQIYEWDPDIILITNFVETMPEDIINNSIEGQDWSGITAVKNKEVYKYPLGMYRWFPPSSDTPLALMWVAKTIQPEMFEYIDLDKEIKKYYSELYNMELTDEDLNTIYNPSREAAW